jgi:hypothetical protein
MQRTLLIVGNRLGVDVRTAAIAVGRVWLPLLRALTLYLAARLHVDLRPYLLAQSPGNPLIIELAPHRTA